MIQTESDRHKQNHLLTDKQVLTGNTSNSSEQVTVIQCFIYGNMRILLSTLDHISLSGYVI